MHILTGETNLHCYSYFFSFLVTFITFRTKVSFLFQTLLVNYLSKKLMIISVTNLAYMIKRKILQTGTNTDHEFIHLQIHSTFNVKLCFPMYLKAFRHFPPCVCVCPLHPYSLTSPLLYLFHYDPVFFCIFIIVVFTVHCCSFFHFSSCFLLRHVHPAPSSRSPSLTHIPPINPSKPISALVRLYPCINHVQL